MTERQSRLTSEDFKNAVAASELALQSVFLTCADDAHKAETMADVINVHLNSIRDKCKAAGIVINFKAKPEVLKSDSYTKGLPTVKIIISTPQKTFEAELQEHPKHFSVSGWSGTYGSYGTKNYTAALSKTRFEALQSLTRYVLDFVLTPIQKDKLVKQEASLVDLIPT
jgi:hypothetical protein